MLSTAERRLYWVAALSPIAALCLIYIPDVGHGFRTDDFAWIAASRVESFREVIGLFGQDNGFYRPVVAVSFAINEMSFGLEPIGYGLTNLALLCACAAAIFAVGRALAMPTGIAMYASILWALNPHGINMSVLWISGRTSLLLILFALLAARAWVQGKRAQSSVFFTLALFSKEEALLLPLVLFAWTLLLDELEDEWRARASRALIQTWPLWILAVAYLGMRAQTDAMLPWTAPAYYKPTLDLTHLARNIAEYADRAVTFALVPIVFLILGVRRWPSLSGRERKWMGIGLAWLIGGFGLTVYIPVRSSLYVCFPSIGSALISAAFTSALWAEFGERGRRRTIAVATLASILMVPLGNARNHRGVQEAELSKHVLEVLAASSGEVDRADIVLHDAREAQPSLASSFGTLISEAVNLHLGKQVPVRIEPPPDNEPPAAVPQRAKTTVLAFSLRGGRLVRIAHSGTSQ